MAAVSLPSQPTIFSKTAVEKEIRVLKAFLLEMNEVEERLKSTENLWLSISNGTRAHHLRKKNASMFEELDTALQHSMLNVVKIHKHFQLVVTSHVAAIASTPLSQNTVVVDQRMITDNRTEHSVSPTSSAGSSSHQPDSRDPGLNTLRYPDQERAPPPLAVCRVGKGDSRFDTSSSQQSLSNASSPQSSFDDAVDKDEEAMIHNSMMPTLLRGVRQSASGKYYGKITINNKIISLGKHDTEEGAAREYDRLVVEHKLDRPLNFPNDYPGYCGQPGEKRKRKQSKTSSYKGVSKVSEDKYRACAWIDKKQVNIGNFSTERQAAMAYDKFIIEHNIDKPLNFNMTHMALAHSSLPQAPQGHYMSQPTYPSSQNPMSMSYPPPPPHHYQYQQRYLYSLPMHPLHAPSLSQQHPMQHSMYQHQQSRHHPMHHQSVHQYHTANRPPSSPDPLRLHSPPSPPRSKALSCRQKSLLTKRKMWRRNSNVQPSTQAMKKSKRSMQSEGDPVEFSIMLLPSIEKKKVS